MSTNSKKIKWESIFYISFIVLIIIATIVIVGIAGIKIVQNAGGAFSNAKADSVNTFPISPTYPQKTITSQPPTATLNPTATPFQPEPPTAVPIPTNTPVPPTAAAITITQTLQPSAPTAMQKAPEAAQITGIIGHPQTLNLSCESRSAADLAGYYDIFIDELEFLYKLPKSDNPHKGFVGDPNGYLGDLPPSGYGVYAQPVSDLLNAYGLKSKAHIGLELETLQKEIASGRPVIVWVITGLGYSSPQSYTASDGEKITVARYEHTVIVTGYTTDTITVLDGNWGYTRSLETFLTSWGVLGNIAITVDP